MTCMKHAYINQLKKPQYVDQLPPLCRKPRKERLEHQSCSLPSRNWTAEEAAAIDAFQGPIIYLKKGRKR